MSLLIFGDVNLGRTVGQELVKGNLEFPFQLVKDTLSRADVVFVNLESQLSDQNGETQHPKYNVIFTGPPSGAKCLKEANVSVVSTANNHAFDYGMKALRETILNLQGAGVQAVGTSLDSVAGSMPAVVEREGFRIGFLAYTQFVNINGSWRGRIALFDSLQARRDIEGLRSKADLLVVSYHGGAEYTDRPSAKLRREFQMFVEAGADLVVGHHPHYVQGIESYRGKLIFYSLGNFVFYQPQLELTQFGLGVHLTLVRRGPKVEVDRIRLLPFRAGLQPSFKLTREEEQSFSQRLMKLSPAQISWTDEAWYINLQHYND
ncbi:MAG: CapA family protein [Ignavibacteria bacterium]|nr:CapA family protein [Ignavibacteria bacterium]